VAAIGKLVASDDGEAHDMAGKIMRMLKPASAEVEEEGDEEEGDGEAVEEEENEDEKETKESREIKRLRAEQDVRDLIEDAGLKFAKPEARRTFIKSLVPLSVTERKALVEERKAAAPAKGSGARSQ